MALNRYRIWLKNGSYQVGVGYTKEGALDFALKYNRPKFKKSDVKSISMVRG